jgi:hypothetical protein
MQESPKPAAGLMERRSGDDRRKGDSRRSEERFVPGRCWDRREAGDRRQAHGTQRVVGSLR